MTKGEGMTPEEYIAKLEEEVESRKEYQQRSQSADGEQIERLLGEKYKLEEENKKLREELSKYKKQYQHSMGFMEEDTLQELRDIGEL